jgi:hypothetical protein
MSVGKDADGHPRSIRTFGVLTDSVGVPTLTLKQNFTTLHCTINVVAGRPDVTRRTFTIRYINIQEGQSALSSSPTEFLDD